MRSRRNSHDAASGVTIIHGYAALPLHNPFSQGSGMTKEVNTLVDAVSVWQAAMAYLHAAERPQKAIVDDQRDGILNPDICVPHTMLTAFSCELCLQAAYAAKNNGKQVDGHNLS